MEGRPTFSIIVPTYCRPKQLAACLESIAQLEYPRELFEVLVVDDGSSSPPPHEIISAFSSKFPVSLMTPKHGGPAAARNAGAGQAKGKFLAFTDDDCAPAPDWLQALATRLAVSPDCMIGGHAINALVHNPCAAASQMLIDYLYSYFNTRVGEGSFFTSNNICVPADHFRAIGGFDVSFSNAAAEDRDFCDRWFHSGRRLIYAPEIIVYHAHALTLKTFWRQHCTYGRGANQFYRLHYQRTSEKLKLNRLTFYSNLLKHPFSNRSGGKAFSTSMLLALSQVATFAGFAWEDMVSRFRLERPVSS
jgi:GT2 family glycosyltransferase